MPGLNVTSPTLVSSTQPYPSSVAQLAEKIRVAGLRDVATALLALEKATEDINRILRQNAPEITQFTVTDADGNLVARLGELPTADGRTLYGIQGLSLYVGDVLGKRDPADAPFFSDAQGHVFIGKNGWLDVLDPYGNDAAWLGTQFDTFPVTGAVGNGSGLIRLTVTGHTLLTGDIARVLDVGGVPNAMGLFTVTKIDANHIDLQGSVMDGTFTSGGTVDRLLHITGAASNGVPNLIRLTITAHGYESGDQVNVLQVGGVANATGQWIVKVIDANHIDLVGSVFAGAYTSGGLAIRYFAGGLFENIAIGPDFPDYHLRAFPDGSLRIKNALITLVGSGTGSATITLDPDMGTITVAANAPSTIVTVISASGVEVGSTVAHDSRVYIEGNAIALWEDVDGLTTIGPSLRIEPEKIELSDVANTVTISLAGPSGAIGGLELNISGALINASREASNFASIDSAVYKVGGNPGTGVVQTVVESFTLTTASAVTGVSGPGVSSVTTGSFVTGAVLTTKNMTYDSGLLIDDV